MATSTPPSTTKRRATENTAPSKCRRLLTDAPKTGTRTISVHVGTGDHGKTFDVYEELLVEHSESFSAALSKAWKEKMERSVSLPEDDALHFEIFFHFLDTGSVFSAKEGDRESGSASVPFDREWGRLSRCWVLGQKLLSSTFKDAVVDAICAKMQGGRYCIGLYGIPYTLSTPSMELRNLLADVVVYEWADTD